MALCIHEYGEISKHFTELTNQTCNFVQDKVTMFLTIANKLYKIDKDSIGEEHSTSNVIAAFEKLVLEK